MRSFQAEGLMKEYIFFYCYTIVTLLVCYLVSLLAYTRPGALLLTIPFVIVATLQVILVMWGAYSIVHKSKESGTDN